jgi:hypothetical protein
VKIINTIIYFINRLLIKALSKNFILYKLFYDSKPIYKNIRMFDCVAYALKSQVKLKNKIISRSKKIIIAII